MTKPGQCFRWCGSPNPYVPPYRRPFRPADKTDGSPAHFVPPYGSPPAQAAASVLPHRTETPPASAPESLPYHGRADKGQKIHMDRPMLIKQRHLLDPILRPFRRHSDHIKILAGKDPPETVDPRAAVMIPADHHQHRPR